MSAVGRAEVLSGGSWKASGAWPRITAQIGWVGLSRLSFAMGIAVLVSLVSASTALAGPVTSHHIFDRFSGQVIDSNVWWFNTNQPDQVTLAEGDGHVTVNVSGAAANDFNAGLSTQCRASGDFDARLSFTLPAWPEFDGVGLLLMAGDTGFNVYRASASWGDSYGAFLPPAGNTVPAIGSSGTLRLIREGSTMTAYYLADHRWVAIASGAGPTADVGINIGVFNISAATVFGGQPAIVEFDEFRLFADGIVCT